MSLDNGPLALAVAMMVGVVAQVLGQHIRVPAIVLLLTAGVALGPDGADVIRPAAMGGGLSAVVGFAVAVILFEGGLSLQVEALRKQAVTIRRLVTIGAVITAVLAALVAKPLMGWDWRLAILFGTLVIVTGPTVVTPLLRRLRIAPPLPSILIAEGILIDAVGATIAVVALEFALAPTDGAVVEAVVSIVTRFGVGAIVGTVVGATLVLAHRTRRLVPHGLENVLVLATVLVGFQVSNALVHESGITAAIVAGLVLGNSKIRVEREVAHFNEQLTALFVATLFVLLAADVRIADVEALGWRGVGVAAALAFVVRPLNIFASTYGTELSLRQKLYLSWIAPRGIVAAAVASLFAAELAHAGIEGGVEMRALVFVVIATTVVIQGLTAAPVAKLLGVRLPTRAGYLVLGANELALLFARALRDLGQPVTLIERDPETSRSAQAAGFAVVEGDGLDPGTLDAADIDSKAHAIAMTPNEQVNLLFVRTIADDFRGPELHVALERFIHGVTPDMIEHLAGGVMFAIEHDLLVWIDRARRELVTISRWRLREGPTETALAEMSSDNLILLAHVRGNSVHPYTHRTALREGDDIVIASVTAADTQVKAWLQERGWIQIS